MFNPKFLYDTQMYLVYQMHLFTKNFRPRWGLSGNYQVVLTSKSQHYQKSSYPNRDFTLISPN
jgi:hypothetical protein